MSQGVVYLAGTEWHRVAATDHYLTTALADALGPSLFVDPMLPVSQVIRNRRAGTPHVPMGLAEVAPGVTRLRTLGPPFQTRPGVFGPAVRWQQRQVRNAARRLGMVPRLVVVATPWNTFPSSMQGARFLHVTDDWDGGADLMGLRRDFVRSRLVRNMSEADLVGGVSPQLVDILQTIGPRAPTIMLANGCALPNGLVAGARPTDLPEGQHVGLVGQLNERIDLAILDGVVDAGMSLVIVGPLTTRDPGLVQRYRELFARDNVTWVGHKPAGDLGGYLSRFTVGITPYRRDAFNESSFPLKTLEYLSYGLPVVATDLPATRWLATDLIDVADSVEEFVAHVGHRWSSPPDPEAAQTRRQFAGRHTWSARVEQLIGALEIA